MKEMIHTSFERTRLRRAIWDKAMVYILSLCAIGILFILFIILAHLFIQGITSLNLDFFTHLPKPVGEKGGGMANAIVGTFTLLGLAICVGVPIGLGAGVYLSEYADLKFAHVVRFMADVMNGIPSIVYGIFAYIVCVLPMKSFSALSGGFALGIMMIPMITRTSEQFVRMVPSQLREAGLALGVPKWRVTVGYCHSCGLGRYYDRDHGVLSKGGRRDSAAFIYSVRQPLLAAFFDTAYCGFAVASFYLCHISF